MKLTPPASAFRPALWTSLRGYTAASFWRDSVAGMTVALVALPLSMAFGVAVGLEPIHGLITSIVGGFMISLLGGSRYQIGGPTAAFVVIIASVLARHGYQGLLTATVLAGGFLIVFGLLRVGRFIEFVPYPVTVGFTTAVGVLIIVGQLRDFLGFSLVNPSPGFLERLGEYAGALGTIDVWSAAFGAATVVGIVVVRRLVPRLPAAAVVVTALAVAAAVSGAPVVTIAGRFGELPSRIGAAGLRVFDLGLIRSVLPDAFSIALLVALESLLTALVADGMTGDRHRSETELIAQGVANIATGLAGGIPVTGAIARTATNIKAGARSPVAGMVHAAALLALVAAASPVAGFIPLACLSGVLMVIAWDMAELHRFVRLLRAPRGDVAVLAATFLLTILVDLTTAVQIGVVLSTFLFMRRMVQVSSISPGQIGTEESPPGTPAELYRRAGRLPERVELYEITGPFFFGVASRLPDLLHTVEREPAVVILQMGQVPVIDASGVQALETTVKGFRDRRTAVILCGVQPQPAGVLSAMGIPALLGQGNVCATLDEAIAAAGLLAGAGSRPPRADGGS